MKAVLKVFAIATALSLSLPFAHAAEHKLLVAEFPGAAHPGYLGVGLRDVTEDRVAALKLKDARGVEVVALDHDGPAAKAGVREHDVILQMNSQEVASEEQLRRMLRETPAGRKADLLLSRDGQEVKVQVVLGDRFTVEHAAVELPDLPDFNFSPVNVGDLGNLPDVEEMDALNSALAEMQPGARDISGAQVEAVGPQLARYFGAKSDVGLLVKDVRPDTAAAKAGMKAGDLVVKAAGNSVASRADWERLLRSNRGKAVPVVVLRDKHEQKLTLTIAARTQGKISAQDFDFGGPQGIAAQTVAELTAQMESPAFKKQMEQAQALAEKAAAEWAKNGDAMQAEIARAQDEAKKATEQWKQKQPEIEKQLREAAEQMRLQMAPMD
jgi:C-terminal processing protease CtpA/Prc